MKDKALLFINGDAPKTFPNLSDYGLGDEAIAKVSDRLAKRGWKLGECENITGDTVKEILTIRK